MRKTLKITISAVLTALSLVYIVYMPTIDLGVWSFTPLSHIFIFIACFISPYTALMTFLAVLGGFMLKTGNYFTWLRAASHLFFVVFLIVYIKIFKLKNKKHVIIAGLCASVIHAVFEILVVLLGLGIGLDVNNQYGTVYYVLLVVGLGTLGHSLLDFSAGFFLYKISKIERFLESSNTSHKNVETADYFNNLLSLIDSKIQTAMQSANNEELEQLKREKQQLENEIAKFSFCEYCGAKNHRNTLKCSNCSANLK